MNRFLKLLAPSRLLIPTLLLLFVLLLLAPIAPALAQISEAASNPPTSQTLLHIPAPMWAEINELLLGFAAVLATALFKYIGEHSPLKNRQAKELLGKAFQDMLDKGTAYGLTQLASAESKVGDIDVGNAAVAQGANFIIQHAPDLSKQMGYDVSTDEGRAAIIRSVALRVGIATGTPGAAGGVVPASVPLPAAVAQTNVTATKG